jgi:NADPH2:quinone reductase
MNMVTMRALRIAAFGPPANLVVREVVKPTPGDGEALVAVRAAAVNPSDVKNAIGIMKLTTLPRTLGRDFAGVVAEGPAEWMGAEVWGTGGRLGFTADGTHAEFVMVPATSLRRKPNNLSFEQAAASGIGFVTAWTSLIDAAGLREGETALIFGAAGAVGSAAAQIAKWRRATAIATDRRAMEDTQADYAINAETDNLADAVRKFTGGRGADVAFNTVGEPVFDAALASLAAKGRMAIIASIGDVPVSIKLLDFYHRQLRLVGVDTLALSIDECARILDQIGPGFESRALHPPRIKVMALERAAEAYEQVLRGSAEKIVLAP